MPSNMGDVVRAVFTSANFTYISNWDLANTWRFMSQHKRLKFEFFDGLNKEIPKQKFLEKEQAYQTFSRESVIDHGIYVWVSSQVVLWVWKLCRNVRNYRFDAHKKTLIFFQGNVLRKFHAK